MPATDDDTTTGEATGTTTSGNEPASKTPVSPLLNMSPLEAISTVGSYLVKIGTALDDLSRTVNSLIVVMQNREAIETILTHVRALAEAASPSAGGCSHTPTPQPSPTPPPSPAGGPAEKPPTPGPKAPDVKDIVSILGSPAVQNLLSSLASQVRRPPGQ